MRPTPGLCPFPPKGQIRQLLRGSPPGANPADIGGSPLGKAHGAAPAVRTGPNPKQLKKKAVVAHRCHRIRAQQQHKCIMLRVHCCNWYHLSHIHRVTSDPYKDCGSPIPRSGLYAFSPCSDPWDDVGHKVSADPTNHPRVDISDLKQGRHLRIPGTPIDVDDICHPPIIRLITADNHGHPRLNAEEQRRRLVRPADGMIH